MKLMVSVCQKTVEWDPRMVKGLVFCGKRSLCCNLSPVKGQTPRFLSVKISNLGCKI